MRANAKLKPAKKAALKVRAGTGVFVLVGWWGWSRFLPRLGSLFDVQLQPRYNFSLVATTKERTSLLRTACITQNSVALLLRLNVNACPLFECKTSRRALDPDPLLSCLLSPAPPPSRPSPLPPLPPTPCFPRSTSRIEEP